MKHQALAQLALAAWLTLTGLAQAQTQAQPSAQASEVPWTEAEVRKIDLQTGKITLKHGEIKNLDMPPMTMVFQTRDVTLLKTFQPGDKVRFVAAQVNGAYTVVQLEAAR